MLKKKSDREDFAPTLVRLIECENGNQFVDISLDEAEALDLVCSEDR